MRKRINREKPTSLFCVKGHFRVVCRSVHVLVGRGGSRGQRPI